jgi:hypothetical protein
MEGRDLGEGGKMRPHWSGCKSDFLSVDLTTSLVLRSPILKIPVYSDVSLIFWKDFGVPGITEIFFLIGL